MKVRLFVLAAAAAFLGCRDSKPPTDLAAPDPSQIILDGAHGGNKDFFFLPPMVASPISNPNYEPGAFNPTLAPALTVEICQLQAAPIDAQGLPVATDCVAGPPLKKFPAGTVQLQNPPDGFYQALWKTRESALDVAKYYRIKVLVEGSSTPFGVADVDPVANMKEFRNARTGEIIPLNDDATLPIKFRIEHGGGAALCGASALCTSATISNTSPTGFQTLTLDGGAGAIAGVRFPNGWLPATGPQNVVVTVAQVDLGSTNPATGTQTNPCHVGLPLQQFAGCFRFTTTPQLAPIDESGRQFATPVVAAVCYVLYGTGDPRENFAELYASGPNEPAHALEDASDVGILAANARNCSTAPVVIGSTGGNSLTRFANATWQKVKSGTGYLFGVKTAYAIDLGLGGFMEGFSNVGPALAANMVPVSPLTATVPGGGNVQRFVRIIGSNHHDGEHQNSVGLAGLPVQFVAADGNATLTAIGSESAGVPQLSIVTDNIPIDIESPVSGGGYAAVNWAVPPTAGTYHLTVNGPAFGGPVTFTVTVPPSVLQLVLNALNDFEGAYRGGGVGSQGDGQVVLSGLLSDELLNAETFAGRIAIDRRASLADDGTLRTAFRQLQQARASANYAISRVPASVGSWSPLFDVLMLGGFADLLAAENWCSGVPTSNLDLSGAMVWGAQQTTQQLLDAAIAKFDQAINSALFSPNFAAVRIGKARALLDRNDFAAAAAEAAMVPDFNLFAGAAASPPELNNGVYLLTNVVHRFSVSDAEGTNGLPFRSSGDPRVAFSAAGLGFDFSTPFFAQQRYPSIDAPIPVATSMEARLIAAEAQLRTGNLAEMTATLNTVRVAAGAPPLTIPTSAAQARDILFQERAYNLWLTSHRLGDLRRLIRQYDLKEYEVFPTGSYHKGGVYGTDVSLPIPVDAQFNPTGMACLSNGA